LYYFDSHWRGVIFVNFFFFFAKLPSPFVKLSKHSLLSRTQKNYHEYY
jgi:hypothetical protein